MDLPKRRSSLEKSTLESRIRRFESSKSSENASNNSKESGENSNNLEEKVKKLEKELKDFRTEMAIKDKQLAELNSLKSKLRIVEKSKEEYEKTNKDLIDQLSKSVAGKSDYHKSDTLVVALKAKLKNSEKLVSELTAENQEINREVKLLAQELEELHDTFREDQVSEFRHMKRELETNAKNIRVLQFKLKKCERMNEQMEEEKNNLEKRLAEVNSIDRTYYDGKKLRDMENELTIAKEVSLKLHAEVGQLNEDKKRMEKELDELKRKSGQNCAPIKRGDAGGGGVGGGGGVSISDQEELVRSLYDTMEREKDLQEQLRFAEEENRNVRKKLSSTEQENEILMMQIKKMTNRKSGPETEKEMTADEMKLNLELNDHELSVLRKKVDEIGQENESLHHEVKYLQEKLVSQPLTKIEIPQIPKGSPSNVIYEHKMRILESEARELRLKLIDREKENENLRTELEVNRRKAAKASMVRSRSLENEASVDLKRQLQLVEQEANILRQKIASVEGENERLSSENRRLQIRVSRRPPPGPMDELQIENIDLKEKIAMLERRSSITSEMSHLMMSSSSASSSASERDIISSMKKQIKLLEEEKVQLNRRITELDLELSKISMDNRRLKDCLDYKKTPIRVVRETATRLELKEIIHQMEGEMNKLQSILSAKDIVIDSLKEELSELKKTMEMNLIELRSKQSSDHLASELKEYQEKCSSLEEQLKSISSQSGNQSVLKVYQLENERKNLLTKIANIEHEAISERNNGNDLREKLNSMVKERDSLANKVKSMNNDKISLTSEINQLKDEVKNLQGSLADMKGELVEKKSIIESVKAEKNAIKKQLEEERRNFNISVSLKPKLSSPSSSTTSNQEGLIKQISELENRNINLDRQLKEDLKEHKERENNLRKEYEKQLTSQSDDLKAAQKQMSSLIDENKSLKSKLSSSSAQIDKLTSDLKDVNEKLRNLSTSTRKEKDDLVKMISDQEAQLRGEQRRREKIERDHEMIIKSKDENLLQARERIFRLEREMKRMEILLEQDKRDHEIVITNYERELNKLRSEYDELTGRQKSVDQELIAIKMKYGKEKDELMDNCNNLRRSCEEKIIELQKFKESFYNRQDEWIKEKLDYQEKLAEAQQKSLKSLNSDGNNSIVRSSPTTLEKDRKISELTRENDRLKNYCDELSRLNELTSKGNVLHSDESKQVQSIKNKMDHAETSHKGEVAALRAEYGMRMKLMKDEVTMLLTERDHLRSKIHLNNINLSQKDEIEDMKAAMESLRSHLEGALLENRNMKVEHCAEKSSWQIQVAELKTKLNQSDEQVLLETSRGSARSYTKTRLELAWEKERQELHKLLTDTQKIVEEMKNQVTSLEAARERERSDARKQLQEMKVIMDREQEDTQKRIGELQLDLIDLRDSHARIRSQNDRLKRERISLEQEREEFRLKIFAIIGVENKIIDIKDQLDHVIKLLPENDDTPNNNNNGEKQSVNTSESMNDLSKRTATSTTTRRTRSRPISENELNLKDLRKLLLELKSKVEEIIKIIYTKDVDDSFRRSISFRRAISSSDMIPNYNLSSTLMRAHREYGVSSIRPPPRPRSMAKKSLSLDHNMTGGSSFEQIWDSGDESIQTTPGSSVSNLKYQPIYGNPLKGVHSSISGYESDSSWRWTRESSYGSDVSAPAAMSGGGDYHHHRHHHHHSSSSSSSSRPKKSFFGLLKKTVSSENTATLQESENGGKEREKKEKSLRSRISRTLRKTLSPSSSNLRKDEDKQPSTSLRSVNNRELIGQRTLSPARIKPPSGHEASTSKGTTINLRSNLRSSSTSSRSTRV